MSIGRILMIPTCWIVFLINLYPLKDQIFTFIQLCCTKNDDQNQSTQKQLDVNKNLISEKEKDNDLIDENDTKIQVSKTKNVIVTCSLLFGCSFLGWIYPHVVDWFSLTGALGGAF